MIRIFISFLLTSFVFAAHAGLPIGDPVKLFVKESTLEWTGKKITGKHNGTLAISEGSLTFHDSVLTGGSFVIDMTTITVSDLSGNGKAKLEGHLKSDDFFGVATYPTATLVVKDAKSLGSGNYDILADLTIKGITNPIDFKATVKPQGTSMLATATITVDRTLYNVRYGSGKFFQDLGDSTIHDEFELVVTLVVGE